jgi:hypothetical protein
MPATIDLEADLLEQCEQIWEATRKARQAELNLREVPPLLRLWDGEMRLQFVVRNEDSADFDIPENDSGPFEIRQRFDTACGQWLWQEHLRIQRGEKRNVNITVDYCGSRPGGLLEYCELECDEQGEQTVIAHFLSDYERLKWYSVWSAPWFGEWLQWPQVYMVPGPLLWCLPLTLDFQLQRERGSTWALSNDPLDPAQRGDLQATQGTWSMVVKPMSFLDAMASGCLWGLAISRFKNFHEMAKAMMADGEIACVIRPWLEGDEDPWEGFTPRHGTRIVEFVDRSGTFTGTSHGGTIYDGLTRTIREFVEDMIDANESIINDGVIPPEYYEVGSKRTQKELPIAVSGPQDPGEGHPDRHRRAFDARRQRDDFGRNTDGRRPHGDGDRCSAGRRRRGGDTRAAVPQCAIGLHGREIDCASEQFRLDPVFRVLPAGRREGLHAVVADGPADRDNRDPIAGGRPVQCGRWPAVPDRRERPRLAVRPRRLHDPR